MPFALVCRSTTGPRIALRCVPECSQISKALLQITTTPVSRGRCGSPGWRPGLGSEHLRRFEEGQLSYALGRRCQYPPTVRQSLRSWCCWCGGGRSPWHRGEQCLRLCKSHLQDE